MKLDSLVPTCTALVRLLERFGHNGHISHVVVVALVREMLLRPGEREEVQRLFIARTALRQRHAGRGEEPGVSASQPTFHAAVGEQIGLRNRARKDQGLWSGSVWHKVRKRIRWGVLGRRHEHGERVSRNAKLWEKVMLDHGVRIKAHCIGVDDLSHDLPRQVVVGLLRRTLGFCVDAKNASRTSFREFDAGKRVLSSAFSIGCYLDIMTSAG